MNTTVFDKDVPNYFGALLEVLNDEELIRIRYRFKKRGNERMREIISDEITERRMMEVEDAKRQQSI